jgi:pSer/pThr/pTyr-binding forkhead associated (FHA) protein
MSKKSQPKQQKICGGCRRVMLPVWTKCLFCGWAPMARLEFILGPMANQTLNLSDEVTTIGSVAGNTVVLADPAVSRKHAGIRKLDGNTYELADLGSTNGIYVNGHKVPKKTLEPGDIIRVGNTEAIFKRE